MIGRDDEIRTPVRGETLKLNHEERKTVVRTSSPEAVRKDYYVSNQVIWIS